MPTEHTDSSHLPHGTEGPRLSPRLDTGADKTDDFGFGGVNTREVISALEHDPDAGVRQALNLVTDLRRSGAFDGVHLAPVSRHNQVAALMRGPTG